MEIRENRSITRLGVATFLPEVPTNEADPDGIVELPSFTSDETSRPTVQMPPLAERHLPVVIEDAFDIGGEDGAPSAGGSPRERSTTLVGVVPNPVLPRT